jgi:hypothetical protein
MTKMPDPKMQAWIDARKRHHLSLMYLANWGTHILKLRLPSSLLDPKTANEYCSGESVFVREKAGRVVLSFISEDEEVDAWGIDINARTCRGRSYATAYSAPC